MIEILAPAGSPEAVIAAVQNGADAVYLGFGDFNARRNAKNFTEKEFAQAAEYCRVRDVKTYVTLNTLVGDRELDGAVKLARTAWKLGADALIVQDLGLVKAIRQALPELPLHASTQMSIHNLEGAKLAGAMGLSRVVLARELSLKNIRHITENAGVETEVFIHGALCMSYSGQCYMSAVIGRRSGNRGLCAQPCRQAYNVGTKGNEYPLSLKDNCLVGALPALERAGVASLKIEGRMKRPEYVGIVTSVYSKVLRHGEAATEEDLRILRQAFSRDGFTDDYLRGTHGPQMLGVRREEDKPSAATLALFDTTRRNYLNGEYQRVPVNFAAIIKKDTLSKLAVRDNDGNMAAVEGPVPEYAFHLELSQNRLKTQLSKSGGTPFICDGLRSDIEPGLSLSVSQINEMRRNLLSQLVEKRRELKGERDVSGKYEPVGEATAAHELPVLNISVMKAEQLSPQLADYAPHTLYIPMEELRKAQGKLDMFTKAGSNIAVIVPRIIHDHELEDVKAELRFALDHGVKEALVGNIGHIVMCRQMGFTVRGDFGLNIYNSHALEVVRTFGLASATASFELRMSQIRALTKTLDTELIVYGRLPLMITENCVAKNSTGVCSCDTFAGITDKNGFTFPVVKSYNCRNVVLNSQKLFLADRSADYTSAGLWGVRLAFTTENARECLNITRRYLDDSDYEPGSFTRGLYYRGVE